VAISRAKKLLVIVGDSKTVIGGAPELFGPLFEHAKQEGLVAGVGAVVTACQRVGIRSQVQRLSRPHRGERRARRRRRGQRPFPDGATNSEAAVEEQPDLVTSSVDGHGEGQFNGGPEMSISMSDGLADAAPSDPIPVKPTTEAEPPL
jgi:hypothetical protein